MQSPVEKQVFSVHQGGRPGTPGDRLSIGIVWSRWLGGGEIQCLAAKGRLEAVPIAQQVRKELV
jgi:hypothetical protein